MNINTKRANALRQLMRAKSYMLVTDRHGELSLLVRNPESFNDLLSLTEERSAVLMFQKDLDDILKQFDKRVAALKKKPAKRAKKA